MFNFSLKGLYDDRTSNYLLLLNLVKWGSVILILVGAFLAIWFSHYWLAIIGGILLIMIGLVLTLVIHLISKKLAMIVAKGGSIIENTEKYLIDTAKRKAKNLMNKSNKDN